MRRIKASAGAAVIEFALVLPILLLIVFAVIEFSVALFNKAVITNASREAARAGIVYVAPNTSLPQAQVEAIALANCQNLISFQATTAPQVAVTYSDSPDFEQQLITVAISYDYTGLGLGSMLTALTGPMTLTASTTMKIE